MGTCTHSACEVVNRRKFPVSLAPAYNEDVDDLFKMWVDCGEDFKKVEAGCACAPLYIQYISSP